MYNKKPPFEITNEILDSITEIAELVGEENIYIFDLYRIIYKNMM